MRRIIKYPAITAAILAIGIGTYIASAYAGAATGLWIAGWK